jgi:hypothetical protein
MDITKLLDIELAKLQGQVYQELMRVQNNLISVNQEIEKRMPKVTQSEPVTTE